MLGILDIPLKVEEKDKYQKGSARFYIHSWQEMDCTVQHIGYFTSYSIRTIVIPFSKFSAYYTMYLSSV
jgi:hypothetical protein